MSNDETSKVLKASCGNCGGERNCEVKAIHIERGGDNYFQWGVNWYVLECRGCDHTFALTRSSNSEDLDYEEMPNGEHVVVHTVTDAYWPALNDRKRPLWFLSDRIEGDESGRLSSALAELYGALQNDLNMLAAIGIRTCFDIASDILEVEDHLTFERKLDQLQDRGHIGSRDLGRLATLVDAGSASAHRGWKPSSTDLTLMMDVLEHFLYEAFVQPRRRERLDQKSIEMSAKVPKRAPRPKGSKGKCAEMQPGGEPSPPLEITGLVDRGSAEHLSPQTDPSEDPR